MATITSVNELWGRRWIIAEDAGVMTTDDGVYAKLMFTPAVQYKIFTYHYNYCNTLDFYAKTGGEVLRFMNNSIYIAGYMASGIAHTLRTGDGWSGTEGVMPRLVVFESRPTGYSFEENADIVAWWNANCEEVTGDITINLEEEYENLFKKMATSIRNKTGKNFQLAPAMFPAEIDSIEGGVEASGTISITENGTYDVTVYANAEVNVAGGGGGITPEGTLEITENGDYDVTNYASASVDVPPVEVIPEGYIKPTGAKTVTSNAHHDVTEYETVIVNVPIPEGYIVPSGTLSVTENGDHDVTSYATVSVNVASGGGGGDTTAEDALITGANIAYRNDRVTNVYKYTFYYSNLKSIDLPNVTTIGEYCCYGAAALESVNLPKLTTLSDYSFTACRSLTSISLPLVTTVPSSAFYNCDELVTVDMPNITSAGYQSFRSCYELTELNFPKLETIGRQTFANLQSITYVKLPALKKTDQNSFQSCFRLTTIDLPSLDSSLITTFQGCYSLKAVVLRHNAVVPMGNTAVFTQCYHFLGTVNSTYNPEGLKDGYVYVPDDLVESYKTATNWSTIADRIKPLSEYVEV